MSSYSLYCAVDSTKTLIKIGITENPGNRIYCLANGNGLDMYMLYTLEFACKHYEYAEILGDEGNYPLSPLRWSRAAESFYTNVSGIARKHERLIKRKFKDEAIIGTEWFPYSESTLDYIKRIFLAVSRSENTALVRTTLKIFNSKEKSPTLAELSN